MGDHSCLRILWKCKPQRPLPAAQCLPGPTQQTQSQSSLRRLQASVLQANLKREDQRQNNSLLKTLLIWIETTHRISNKSLVEVVHRLPHQVLAPSSRQQSEEATRLTLNISRAVSFIQLQPSSSRNRPLFSKKSSVRGQWAIKWEMFHLLIIVVQIWIPEEVQHKISKGNLQLELYKGE